MFAIPKCNPIKCIFLFSNEASYETNDLTPVLPVKATKNIKIAYKKRKENGNSDTNRAKFCAKNLTH